MGEIQGLHGYEPDNDRPEGFEIEASHNGLAAERMAGRDTPKHRHDRDDND